MTFGHAGRSLPDGEAIWSGLYGEFGGSTLKVCTSAPPGLPEASVTCIGAVSDVDSSLAALRCTIYEADIDLSGPALVEVTGRLSGQQLAIDSWQPLAWNQEASLVQARETLDRQSDALASLDWSQIALPRYVESTAQARLRAADWQAVPLALFGYDQATGQVIWRGQGVDLPAQQPLVTRYPVVYLFSAGSGQDTVGMVATIEGFVEE